MSLRKQQDFLARLFTDESLRQNFLEDSAKIGAENGLSAAEIADLQAVLPQEIRFFAESLFWKRLREVEKFLPLTKNTFEKDFTELFRTFSQNYNPHSIKKHLEDALEFCKFLQSQNISDFSKNVAKFEKTKLDFFANDKNFAFCKLNYNIKTIHDNTCAPKKQINFAVWLKIGNKTHHFTFQVFNF